MSIIVAAIFAAIAVLGSVFGIPAWACLISGIVALFSALWAVGTWEKENSHLC